MEIYTIERTDEQPLRFEGELIASVNSYRHDNNIRWTELALYRTRGGRYACVVQAKTILQGESYFTRAAVVEDAAAVVEYFGPAWLSRKLFYEAGIDDEIDID